MSFKTIFTPVPSWAWYNLNLRRNKFSTPCCFLHPDPCKIFHCWILGRCFRKALYGLFGAKSDMASAFIRIFTQMEAEALSGFAMPAWALASGSQNYLDVTSTDALEGIAKPTRLRCPSVSFSVLMNADAMSGFIPKGPQGFFGRFFLIFCRGKCCLHRYGWTMCCDRFHTSNPNNIFPGWILATSFQKALRALWDEARHSFGGH